ncbi:unnamed protein product [Agarophyton chilense]
MNRRQQSESFERQLSKGQSVDIPTGSTIYDPAIISLREDFKARVEERKAKRLEQDAQHVSAVQSPMHISSPSPVPRTARKSVKSVFRAGDQTSAASAASASEELDVGDFDVETELCCNGYVPLYPFLIFMSVVKILAGIAGIAIGSSEVMRGGGRSVGVASVEKLIISGSFLFAIAFIAIGMLLVISGCVGIVLFSIRLRTNSRKARRLDVVYHSGVFLLAIILFVVFGLTVWVWSQSAKGGIYSDALWKELVRSNPWHVCKTEERLKCAAFEQGQCREDNKQSREMFCAGHFCVDFCRITTDEVNVQPICEACGENSVRAINAFVTCKRLETEWTDVRACEDVANAELQVSYGRLLAAALVSFVWIMASVCASTYRYCFV